MINFIFLSECIVKMLAEGLAPLRYFTAREWKWNWFDFLIVFMCLKPIQTLMGGGGSVKLLRLMRLARLSKLIRKIPQLQMIVMGLVGGLKVGHI